MCVSHETKLQDSKKINLQILAQNAKRGLVKTWVSMIKSFSDQSVLAALE